MASSKYKISKKKVDPKANKKALLTKILVGVGCVVVFITAMVLIFALGEKNVPEEMVGTYSLSTNSIVINSDSSFTSTNHSGSMAGKVKINGDKIIFYVTGGERYVGTYTSTSITVALDGHDHTYTKS